MEETIIVRRTGGITVINFKKVEHETLESTINDIFKEQDEHHFGEEVERHAEEIAIGAYDGKKIVGGIVARKEYQNIHVSILAVRSEYRGQDIGSQLLSEVERIGRESGIINLTLTTRSYQAVDFYKKAGFKVFAKLDDMPMKGVTKYYFNKRLSET